MSTAAPMRPHHRFVVYSDQNGGSITRFTGPQRRRFMKKYRRIEKKMRLEKERQEATLTEVPAEVVAEPATRPCGGTDYCITKSGKKASKPHVKCEAV